MRRRLPRILLILAFMALPLVALRSPAVRGWLVALVLFMRGAGAAGVAAFVGVEALATLLLAPMWLMSGLAGYAYGFGRGLVIALPAITLCTSVSFLLGRLFARAALAPRGEQSHYWEAVRRAVHDEGLKITLLLRVTFAFPQNLLSYLLSATPLRFREFALGTFVGLVPATLLHVYVGSIVESAAALVAGEGSAKGPIGWIALVGGLAATVTGVFFTSRLARRALDRALAARAAG
jgi:uncharacterized membrane protein YdjX (TVP38/TMEM64 family)